MVSCPSRLISHSSNAPFSREFEKMPNVIPGCELMLRDGRAGKARTFLIEEAPQALKRVHLNPNTAFTIKLDELSVAFIASLPLQSLFE